jgi:hypothetical protein
MINAFGDYHRVFWNCQTFAKCFLQIICGPDASAKFSAWTLSDASSMVDLSILPCLSLTRSFSVHSSSASLWLQHRKLTKHVKSKNYSLQFKARPHRLPKKWRRFPTGPSTLFCIKPLWNQTIDGF